MKQYFKHISPIHQLILLIIITLSSWVIFSIFGMMVSTSFWGIKALTNTDVLLSNTAFLKYFQVIQSIGLFIFPPIVFEFFTEGKVITQRKYSRNLILLLLFISIFVVAFAQPFISFLGVFNNGMELPEYLKEMEVWMRDKEVAAQSATETFLSFSHWSESILNIFIIAILPAIGEELLFRGSLQRIMQSLLKNNHIAVIVTAALFSAIHIQFFGFLPRFILGVIFGYLMIYSKNIWFPIIAHFTNNFMAYIIYHSYQNNDLEITNPLSTGSEYPEAWQVIISCLSIIAFIIVFNKITSLKTQES